MSKSPIYYGDSYKYGHSKQYPQNMVDMYDYMSSRGGKYPATLFVGAQGLIKQYLTTPVTIQDVEKISKRAALHGIPFDKEGWLYIVSAHKGFLPIEIKAVPEGTLIPTGNVLMTIVSTDSQVPWVVGFVETLLMKIWYPTTIATKSYYVKQMLLKYGSKDWAKFAYHAFGDRACTSPESADIAGFAHLSAGFYGTDNFGSLDYCEQFYNVSEEEPAGYSVYATEHSTTTSHTKKEEEAFVYKQLLDNPDKPIMSFVADSYDVYNFTNFCTASNSRIRKLIESRPHQKLVLRPDSGDPIEVLEDMLDIMEVNKVDVIPGNKILFKDFSILWGDGITPETIEEILEYFTSKGFAAENFVFGSGGDLMQKVDRDTQKFAIKCSNITIDEGSSIDTPYQRPIWDPYYVEVPVFKDPITDPGKKSLKGKIETYITQDGKFILQDITQEVEKYNRPIMKTIFKNGKTLNETSLKQIRNTHENK